jgi:lysophospholipase L1-like esterase
MPALTQPATASGKKAWTEGTALGLAICLGIALTALCSNQGIGLAPGAVRWLPRTPITEHDWPEIFYSFFLRAVAHLSHAGLPSAARWPQIVLFALTVAVAVFTVLLRSDLPFAAAIPTVLLVAISPQVLRIFTVLSPESLMIFAASFCLLAAEEYGRGKRRTWLVISILMAALTSFSAIGGWVIVVAVRFAFDAGRRRTAAWGHFIFAFLYAITSVMLPPLGQRNFISGPVLVAWVIFLGSAARTPRAVWLMAGLLVLQCAFGIPWIVRAERDGHDFAERRWKHSPTIQALNRLRGQPTVYSNRIEPLVLYTHDRILPLPQPQGDSTWPLLQRTLTTTDSFVVLFGDAQQEFVDISKRVPLEEYRTLADGEILRGDASASVGGKRTPPFSDNTPSVPARRAAGHFEWWNKKHDDYVKQAAQGNIDLLFLGDSITDDFRKVPGAWDFFQERFAKYHAANFGIDGDHTQHLLFRILNGECDHIHPRVAVILIGTNNTADDSAAAIARGIGACVAATRQKLPQTRILLLGLFPRGGSATDNDKRPVIQAVNRQIARFDNGDTVRFLNLYDKFLAPGGSLSKQIMYDGLHPSLQGYHIWLDAMQPLLEQMMRLPPATAP